MNDKNLNLLKFKYGTFEYYRNKIHGNKDISIEQAERKMTRNMLLAKTIDQKGHKGKYFMYGALHFVVHNNEITWIKNNCRTSDWKLNKRYYLWLNKELGIDEDITYAKLTWRQFKGKLRYWKNKIKWKIILKFKR